MLSVVTIILRLKIGLHCCNRNSPNNIEKCPTFTQKTPTFSEKRRRFLQKCRRFFLNSPIVWVRYAPAIIFEGAKSILMSFMKKLLLLFFEKKKIEILTDVTETLGIYAQMCWDIQ